MYPFFVHLSECTGLFRGISSTAETMWWETAIRLSDEDEDEVSRKDVLMPVASQILKKTKKKKTSASPNETLLGQFVSGDIIIQPDC